MGTLDLTYAKNAEDSPTFNLLFFGHDEISPENVTQLFLLTLPEVWCKGGKVPRSTVKNVYSEFLLTGNCWNFLKVSFLFRLQLYKSQEVKDNNIDFSIQVITKVNIL